MIKVKLTKRQIQEENAKRWRDALIGAEGIKSSDVGMLIVADIEIPEKRTEKSKTYHLFGNEYRVINSHEIIHYKDDINSKTEEWKPVDLTVEDKGSYYGVSKSRYSISIYKDKVGYVVEAKEGGKIYVELIEINDKPVNISNANIFADKDCVRFNDIEKDLDVYIKLKAGKISFLKELKSETASRKFKWLVKEEKDCKLKFDEKVTGSDSQKRRAKISTEQLNVQEVEIDGKQYTQYEFIDEFEGQVSDIVDRRIRRKEWIGDVNWPFVSGHMVDATYPVTVDPVITQTVQSNLDDVLSIVGTGWNPQYLLGNPEVGLSAGGAYEWIGGFRFQNLAIPKEATINSATLTLGVLYAGKAGAATRVDFTFYGNDIDNAGQWGTGNQVRNISKTGAKLQATNDGSYPFYGDFPYGVTDIVQEIINRPGWSTSNDLAIGVFNGVTTVDARVVWRGYAEPLYTGVTLPTLVVDYTAVAGARSPGGGVSYYGGGPRNF